MKCRQCRKKISLYARECPYCGAVVEQTGKEVADYLQEVTSGMERVERKEKHRNRKHVSIHLSKRTYQAVASMMIVVMFTGVTLVSEKRKWKSEGEKVVYLSEEGMYSYNMRSEKAAIISKTKMMEEDFAMDTLRLKGQGYHVDEQKGIFYYVDTKEDPYGNSMAQVLYRKPLDELTSKPECISEGISEVLYDEEDNAYYVNLSNTSLKRYDGCEEKTLEFQNIYHVEYRKDLRRLFVCSAEDGNIYGGMSESDCMLYEVDTKTFQKREMFRMTRNHYEISLKDQCIYYIYDNAIYKYDLNDNMESLIDMSVDAFALEQGMDKDNLYYITYIREEAKLYDFVKDEFYERDKKAKVKTEEIKRREELRKELKSESFDQLSTVLHCYENGESREIAKGVAELDPYSYGSGEYVKVPSIQMQKKIEKEYRIKEDGVGSAEEVINFYLQIDGEESTQDIRMRSYREPYTGDDGNTEYGEFTVYCGVEQEFGKVLINGKIEDLSRFREQEYYKELDEKYSKSRGDITCKYDFREECLKICNQLNRTETVLNNAHAYQILDDGSVVCLVYEDDLARNLVIVEKSGEKRVLAKNVWRLLGEDVCYVDSELELAYSILRD